MSSVVNFKQKGKRNIPGVFLSRARTGTPPAHRQATPSTIASPATIKRIHDDEDSKLQKFRQAKRKFAAYGTKGKSPDTTDRVRQDVLQNTLTLQEAGEWEVELNKVQYHLMGISQSNENQHVVREEGILHLLELLQNPRLRQVVRVKGISRKCWQLFELPLHSKMTHVGDRGNLVLIGMGMMGIILLQEENNFNDISASGMKQMVKYFSQTMSIEAKVKPNSNSKKDQRASKTSSIPASGTSRSGNEIGVPTAKKKRLQKKKKPTPTRTTTSSHGTHSKTTTLSTTLAGEGARKSGYQHLVDFIAEHYSCFCHDEDENKQRSIDVCQIWLQLMEHFLILHDDDDASKHQQQCHESQNEHQLNAIRESQSLISSSVRSSVSSFETRKSIFYQNQGFQALTHWIQHIQEQFVDSAFQASTAKSSIFHSFGIGLRCLKLVEQLSSFDRAIQNAFISDNDCKLLIPTIVELIDKISAWLWMSGNAKAKKLLQAKEYMILSDVLLACLGVVMNLTNGNQDGIAAMKNEGMSALLSTFSRLYYHQHEKQDHHHHGHHFEYDVFVFSMSALTNMIEENAANQQFICSQVIQSTDATSLSVCSFFTRFLLQKTSAFMNRLLESPATKGTIPIEPPTEKDHNWKSEDVILAGYCCFLLFHFIRGPDQCLEMAAMFHLLSQPSPQVLIKLLEAFVNVHTQMGVLTSSLLQPILQMIEELKELDEFVLSFMKKNNHKSENVNSLDLLREMFLNLQDQYELSIFRPIVESASRPTLPKDENTTKNNPSSITSSISTRPSRKSPYPCTPPHSAFHLSPMKSKRLRQLDDDNDNGPYSLRCSSPTLPTTRNSRKRTLNSELRIAAHTQHKAIDDTEELDTPQRQILPNRINNDKDGHGEDKDDIKSHANKKPSVAARKIKKKPKGAASTPTISITKRNRNRSTSPRQTNHSSVAVASSFDFDE